MVNLFMKQYVQKYSKLGFPGGAFVKNPPPNAGDTGLSPSPGRSHMEQLSPCATTTEPEPAL